MDVVPSGITTTDRLCLAGFGGFILLCLLAGAIAGDYLSQSYIDLPSQWTQGLLGITGICAGTIVGLVVTRLSARRYVPHGIKQRWYIGLSQALANPYVQRRGLNLVKMFRWAVAPDGDAL